MTKKILAVVLAAVMILSTLALSVSALTYEPTLTGGEVKIITTADKTTVEPGDVVTFTMSIDAGSVTDLAAFGIALTYNKAQLSIPSGVTTAPAFRTWEGDCATSFANPSAGGNLNYAFTNANKAYMTAEEQAYYDGGIMILGSSTSSANRWNPSAGEAFMTYQMVVSDTVSAGDEIWIGAHSAAFANKKSYVQYQGTTRLDNSKFDLSESMVKLTVGAASPVEFQKAQIRFKGITATSGAATYENSFDVRTVAQITEANFATFFTDEATAKAKITDFGFVYAAKSNVATFDADTAKDVAEGGSAANYVKVPVTYMQHTGGNYIFTCLISNIADADKTDGVNCLGYVCFDGTYYYFDAAASVDFNTLYTTNMPA